MQISVTKYRRWWKWDWKFARFLVSSIHWRVNFRKFIWDVLNDTLCVYVVFDVQYMVSKQQAYAAIGRALFLY